MTKGKQLKIYVLVSEDASQIYPTLDEALNILTESALMGDEGKITVLEVTRYWKVGKLTVNCEEVSGAINIEQAKKDIP